MGALAATLIPACVGVALLGLAGPLRRRFGAEAAATFAVRAALAAAVLAALLLAQVFQRGWPAELRFAWIHAGRTTTIDWLVFRDPLALLLGGVALLGLGLAPIAVLAGGGERAARAAARATAGGGALLLLATAGTLWQAGLAVALAVLACGTWPEAQGSADMSERAWPIGLVAAGLATAGLAWLVGAGDLELATLERTGLAQGASALRTRAVGGPFGGLAPASVGGLAAIVAALAWIVAWPRLLARAWADGPAAAGFVALAVAPAIPAVLLRVTIPLALAPTGLAALTGLAAATAAWAGWRAARARSSEAFVAACGQVTLALATAAIGIGDFVAATRVVAAHGLATAALVLALGCGRRVVQAVAGVAAIGWLAGAAAAVAGLWGLLSAWSSGINAVATALALLGIAGVAAGLRRVLTDRCEGTGWAQPEAGSLLAGSAGLLALAGAAVGLGPLEAQVGPIFVGGRMLVGAFALGPRPEALVLGPWAAGLLVAIAAVAGVAGAGRVTPRAPRRRGGGLGIGRLVAVAEGGLRTLVLGTGDERVAAAPRGTAAQTALVGTAAGALAILGSVFCNPDVVVLGPTRVHPVDLGGLDAAMTGSRRAGPEPNMSVPALDEGDVAARAAQGRAVDEAGMAEEEGSAGGSAGAGGGVGANMAGEPGGGAAGVAGGAGSNGQGARDSKAEGP